MNEMDGFRQELIDAVAHDGMGLAAANLHDGPVPPRRRADRLGELGRSGGIAIFFAEFHGGDLLVGEIAERPEMVENAAGFLFVDHADRKADMHQHIVADTGFRRVSEVDLLDDAAEIHPTDPHQIVARDRRHLSRNR